MKRNNDKDKWNPINSYFKNEWLKLKRYGIGYPMFMSD